MKHRNTLLFSSSLYDLQKLGLSQCIIELVRHLKYKLVAKNISRKDIVDLFISCGFVYFLKVKASVACHALPVR